jgi:hypothetical protein
MRAQLEAVGTFQESDLARHALIGRLNAAYNTLDLRAGWGNRLGRWNGRTPPAD